MKKSDLNVLVVDDDATFRSAMSEAIKRFGYKAHVVAKADEALSAVKIKQYHVALIDCMLPRQNGVDLAYQLRRTRFGSAPIILISGVFKDRVFMNESVERVKAAEFLTKPFEISELQKLLEKTFKPLLSPTQVPLHVLVSRPFSSTRERTKVIEGLEEVKGFDLPFILCVLIDAGASGHLNIINHSDEIYGITLQDGRIVSVDSSEKEATLLMLLLEMGYISREDLSLVQNSVRRGDLIQSLIAGQHISPHVLPLVTKEQVITDLKRLFVNESLNINFVPERKRREYPFGFDLEDLIPLLYEIVRDSVTMEYLKEFYSGWMDHPIQTGPAFSPLHPVFNMDLFKELPNLPELLTKTLTMDEIRAQGRYDAFVLFRCLHLLTFRRMIIFDDVKKAKGAAEHADRIRQMLKELEGKNPIEVFNYFGVDENVRVQEVENVYREFARANHPDRLPPNASAEFKKTVNQVFSIVSEAHDTLANKEKREKLMKDLKQREAEIQLQAENLTDEAIMFLRRGRVQEALAKTTKAYHPDAGRNIKIAHAWALLKSGNEHAAQASQILESIPHEDRRISQYAFVLGLLKKNLNDMAGAKIQFEKAISLDPNFLEARREQNAITGLTEKVDIFKADIGKLVGDFFRKRK